MQTSRLISLILAASLLVTGGFALKISHDTSNAGNAKDTKEYESKLKSNARFLLSLSIALILLGLIFGGVTIWEMRSNNFGY